MMAKENKRELILNALEELLPGKRFHEITLDEVAKTAGVGKGTIYLYFHDKDELFAELVCCRLSALQEELATLFEQKDSDLVSKIFDLIAGFIRRHHSGFGTSGNLFATAAKLSAEQFEKLKVQGSAVIDTVAEVMKKIHPSWSAVEAREYAQMLLWMIDGYARAKLSGAKVPEQKKMEDFFRNGAGIVQQ